VCKKQGHYKKPQNSLNLTKIEEFTAFIFGVSISEMELESIPLQKDDSTQTKAPLKHAPVKKNATRRASANKLAAVTTNDSMHLAGDARLGKEREFNEAQKNVKSDNMQVKTIEKPVPTSASINKEEKKARMGNSPIMQQGKVKDIQQN
ncbi:1319_t:CDS:2, partial [Acaulospora morrowiae]